MKKIVSILFFTVVLSIAVAAQTKKDSVAPVIKYPPDTAKIFSKNDLEAFIKYFRDNYSVTYYDQLKPHEVIQQLYIWFIREYNAPPKQK